MKKFLKWLADLKLAIFFFLSIAFFSLIGSIIEQEKSNDYYQLNYPLENSLFGFLNYESILFFGFNNLFQSWWFISLLILFGSSLLVCTFLQQFPSLDFSRSLNFLKKTEKNQRLKKINSNFLSNFLIKIQKDNYFIFQNFNSFYAYKGILGKLGPIFVHISIILILIGSLIAALYGFTAQEIVPKSEIFYIQNTTATGDFHLLPQIPVRINDFWIRYNNDGQISQFFSNLSILSGNGQENSNMTISVNKPLISNSLVWYQTEWDILGLRIKLDNSFYQFPLTQISSEGKKIWLSWIPINFEFNEGILLRVDNLSGSIMQYNNFGFFESFIELGQKIQAGKNLQIFLSDILPSTGLQIKLDPGIFLIYLGFGFLIISSLLSYLSYSRIWILNSKKDFLVRGFTNRAKLQFEIQFLKFLKD